MERQKADFFIKRYQLEHLVPLALTILSVYFWLVSYRPQLTYLIGIVINVVGLGVWWAAKITLAGNWDAGYGQPKIKKLVTWGIYAKIRHPLYWGINITLIGLSLIHLNLILSVISLIIVIYFFSRMRAEDAFLLNQLGAEYSDYKKKTWI